VQFYVENAGLVADVFRKQYGIHHFEMKIFLGRYLQNALEKTDQSSLVFGEQFFEDGIVRRRQQFFVHGGRFLLSL
jgi:hypothetical protein